MKSRLILVSTLLATIVSSAAAEDFSKVEIKAIHVAGNIYMLSGSGGNIGADIIAAGHVHQRLGARPHAVFGAVHVWPVIQRCIGGKRPERGIDAPAAHSIGDLVDLGEQPRDEQVGRLVVELKGLFANQAVIRNHRL